MRRALDWRQSIETVLSESVRKQQVLIDLYRFFKAEVIGVPVEALGTRTYYLTVTYNKENKVIDIKTSKEKGDLNWGSGYAW